MRRTVPLPPITTFGSLLVANRGEIALRVMRSAKSLGLRTIAVYSDADREAPHVRAADDAVRIGPGPAPQSYLSVSALLEAAERTGADAIHPGYGFLSERPELARAAQAAGLVFVGPPADVIDLMGRKDRARESAVAAGLRVLPSVPVDELLRAPDALGFPLVVKATAGGGGKGMRVVRAPAEVAEAVEAARREALGAFGDQSLIAERFVDVGRHIEVQVIADRHGSVVHLGERDCSPQRRHQKVLEEAPAPTITARMRADVTEAAVALARSVGYSNAGTVEFLLDGDDAFFLEMNTRLQVEHPVTELVTGQDLVALQLVVADGQLLPIEQADVQSLGHAIEARVYAEDPFAGFLPQAGTATFVRWTGRARVDAAVESGQVVGTDYDPMLGKVIAYGPTREAARLALVDALDDSAILGLPTNLGFVRTLAASAEFRDASIHTTWIEDHQEERRPRGQTAAAVIAAWTLATASGPRSDPFDQGDGWRLAGEPVGTSVELLVGGSARTFVVHLDGRVSEGILAWTVVPIAVEGPSVRLQVDGVAHRAFVRIESDRVEVSLRGQRWPFLRRGAGRVTVHGEERTGVVLAPMPGTLTSIRVALNEPVGPDDVLGVLEAMKMEFPLVAGIAGRVASIRETAGTQVDMGTPLFMVETDDRP
jgi:acetyl-CoA/propionyl-CoA carboxylase biotin carboxyl carrier protein